MIFQLFMTSWDPFSSMHHKSNVIYFLIEDLKNFEMCQETDVPYIWDEMKNLFWLFLSKMSSFFIELAPLAIAKQPKKGVSGVTYF